MTDVGGGRELVFVYGTLRRGGSNAFRMEGAAFRGAARVQGELHAITWYPGLTLKEGAGWVIGELYEVGPELMRALDEFEGLSAGEVEGSEYRRVRVPVQLHETPEQQMVWAWAYEWKGPVDPGKKIASGDWLDVMRPRAAPVFTIAAAVATLSLLAPLLAYTSLTGRIFWGLGELLFVGCFYGLPLIGLGCLWIAHRRREPYDRLRVVLCGVCVVWVCLWATIGLTMLT